jgi:ATP/maltotriose-dependent transcriptional regulator MalT
MAMTSVRRHPRYAVDRPSLRARLDAGITAPLTLVVAPAGSGKTVLLSQWVMARRDVTIAWVDVARADTDPVVFGAHLVDAVTRADSRFGPLGVPVGTPDRGLGDPFVDAVAAELGDLEEVVIVLDDLHHLTGTKIVADLWRLVDRLPDNAHFIFASRVDLNLAWRRHRLSHGLVELRQAELAFDSEVTGRVIANITGVHVTAATAEAVTMHTEGWAAGVQLSALSMRFTEHPERVADHLAETDRLILDYLTEEIFDAQSPSRRRALLRLSVLDEMSASLVEAVAGVADGGRLLKELERESLFLIPVADRIGWYRFHHLFRDLLRYRLRASEPEREADSLNRAAQWLIARGETSTAVEYLIRAREWGRVCEIVLASSSEDYERLRTTTIARWLSLIPREVRVADPRVELLYGMVTGMSGRGARCVEIMRGLLAADVLDAGGRQLALTYIAASVYLQPHPDLFLEAADRSLAALRAEPDAVPPNLLGLTTRPLLEAVTYVSLARAHFLLGDLRAARTAAEASLAVPAAEYGPYRVQIAGTLALIEAWAGRLRRAGELADGALELARELSILAHPSPSDAHLARAIVAIQRGEAAIGAHSLHEGGIRAAVNQRTQLMWVAHAASSLIDPSGSDPGVIEPPGHPPPIVAQAVAALQWRDDRLSGNPRQPPRRPESTWSTLAFEQVATLLEQGAIGHARTMLAKARYHPDPAEPAAIVEYDIACAWLAAAEGHTVESRTHLLRALELAESEGLAYPIIAAGPAVLALVDDLTGPMTPFRAQISRSLRSPAAIAHELPTPLTSRERELLQYLPTRMTNGEIAAKCYISVNTVKTHMVHLYRKLGVADRTAAVAKAEELGLLR